MKSLDLPNKSLAYIKKKITLAVMNQLSYFLICVIFYISIPITFAKNKNSDKVLSRKRRFLIPQTSGWTFTVTGDLTVPLEFTGSSISADTSFTYSLDDGRYKYFSVFLFSIPIDTSILVIFLIEYPMISES